LDGSLSREYLARGTAGFQPDSTISLVLREIDPASEIPWTPDARPTPGGVRISYYDLAGESLVTEIYRRQ
jgi:hypothetical protein